jgi:hypothetical protein
MVSKRCLCLLVVISLVIAGNATAAGPVWAPASRVASSPLPGSTTPQAHDVILSSAIVNVTLMSQLFLSADMPIGWQTQISNTTRSWGIIDATQNITDFSRYVHTFPCAAFITYDLSPQDEWLYTPFITIPLSLTDAKLSFWALTDTRYLTATVSVFAIDALGTKTELWKLEDEGAGWPTFIYRLVQSDLTPFLGQTIRFAWWYHGYDGESFGLDDVEISGNAEGIWLPAVFK